MEEIMAYEESEEKKEVVILNQTGHFFCHKLNRTLYAVSPTQIIPADPATEAEIASLELVWIGSQGDPIFVIWRIRESMIAKVSWKYVALLRQYHGSNVSVAYALMGWLVMASQRDWLTSNDVKVPSAQLTGKSLLLFQV
jgi:hypothetical protein